MCKIKSGFRIELDGFYAEPDLQGSFLIGILQVHIRAVQRQLERTRDEVSSFVRMA